MSLNTETGSRPGFMPALNQAIQLHTPDVVALQEVHNALCDNVPEMFMPRDPGKRQYPMRLKLYQEIVAAFAQDYQIVYEFHMHGLHDLELTEFAVTYGQALLVHKRCALQFTRSDFIYGRRNQLNTEKSGGTPAGKVAVGAKIGLSNGASIVVTNVHGFWSMHGKIDCSSRIVQNSGIGHHLKRLTYQKETSYILCAGDLNYRSDMRALEDLRLQSVFGEGGGVILNHQFGITRTRTAHYSNWENQPEADFMIATPALAQKATDFSVDLKFPSDHGLLIGKFRL